MINEIVVSEPFELLRTKTLDKSQNVIIILSKDRNFAKYFRFSINLQMSANIRLQLRNDAFK